MLSGLFHKRCLIACLMAFSLAGESNAIADSPTAEIKSTVDQVIKILTNPRYKGEANKEERRKLLREVIFARFDFQEMAKRSLGPEWDSRTPDEQKEFVKLFTDLLEKAYVRKIESYNNENFIYTGENIQGSYAEVDSKVITTQGEEFEIDYMLHRVENDWKVYDVVIENISLVNNYRSQFNRVLAQSSYQELIRRVKEKLAEESGK